MDCNLMKGSRECVVLTGTTAGTVGHYSAVALPSGTSEDDWIVVGVVVKYQYAYFCIDKDIQATIDPSNDVVNIVVNNSAFLNTPFSVMLMHT